MTFINCLILTVCAILLPSRPLGIPVLEFQGISLEKFPRGFPGILLRSAFNFLYNIISSFDKCSYSARRNVKLHYNFVDSSETLKKFVSRLQCPQNPI